MNANLAGLLQACKDEPFDDGLRLILSDYLEDHGDPDRAELIRVQLALPEPWGDEPEGVALEVRRDCLLRAKAEHWFGPARGWYTRVSCERGFLRIDATPQQLLDHSLTELPGDLIPWLEELYLRPGPEGHDDVLTSPLLGLFSRLDLTGDMRGDPARQYDEGKIRLLTSNPALRQTRSLQLPYSRIGREAARLLARCDYLAGLRELELYCNPLGDAGAVVLAEAPWLAGITRLNLGDTQLSAKGLTALFTSPHLGVLTHLKLSKTRINVAEGRALTEAPKLAGLMSLSLEASEAMRGALDVLGDSSYLRPLELDMNSVPLYSRTIASLAAGPFLQRVRHLKLGSNRLPEGDSAVLLESERLASLEFLQMWNPIGDAGCEILASSGHFANLRRLTLYETEIGPAGAQVLGRARHLGALTTLTLDANPIGPKGVVGLAEGGGLPALAGLYLEDTHPTIRGVRALTAGLATQLRRLSLADNDLSNRSGLALAGLASGRLEELVLACNRIGPTGLAALVNCPALGGLLSLDLYQNKVGDAGVQALLSAKGLPRLMDVDLRENQLTAIAGEALRDWPHRQQMTSVCVEDAGISTELQAAIRVDVP